MALDVVTEIEIDRPPAVVAAFARDPDNARAWYANIEAAEWRSPPPLAVGSRIGFVASFLGRRLAYTYEVREMSGDERFVMATSEGPFAMETTYAWRPTASGGTHMTLRNRGRPRGFPRLIAPLMSVAVRRANRADLRRLRDLLERGGASPRPPRGRVA